MGRKTKARRPRTAPDTYSVRATPNWPLLALSSLGMALTAYLSWAALSGGGVQGCSAGGGCDVVLTSRWATLLGVPTSLWGFFGYAALAAIAFVRRADRQWSWAWTIAVFGVCYSVYLTVVSLTILQSACPYCLTSLALMTAILGLVVVQRPVELADRSWLLSAAGRVALAGVVILLVHGNNVLPQEEPTGPEDPKVRALAEHLKDEGVLFYGASWCPHCQEQKRLFGASAKRLPYVECSLAGPNGPQSPSCNMAGVQTYPTWFIKGRAYSVGQVLSLAELANASGFPDAASFRQ
ncbi:MAG TPA: vitamin K epoxide reductase family protein [Vicinamibacterales bacterium]|nr:vitamin K epoxide reductase family protein [Vicinamibacterales bacterium]